MSRKKRPSSHPTQAVGAGGQYVATVRLTDKAGNVLAMPGDTCSRVPESSLRALFLRGRIKVAAKATLTPGHYATASHLAAAVEAAAEEQE